jgi:hypothetical protein
LSEAINSMFRWYRNASVCYAYLEDVHGPITRDHGPFHASRWFTRGWTLQELIAPSHVIFYASTWMELGTRYSLGRIVSDITGIDETFLSGSEDVSKASISKRMSWASRRNTTRKEDAAYCLFGLFDVNLMPLYGEGEKAFLRLQEELMKRYPRDHTLFAWGNLVEKFSAAVDDPAVLSGERPLTWDEGQSRRPLLGLLAQSPRDFASTGHLVPWDGTRNYYDTSIADSKSSIGSFATSIGNGVRVGLPLMNSRPTNRSVDSTVYSTRHWPRDRIVQLRRVNIGRLLCGLPGSVGPAACIELMRTGDIMSRTDELVVKDDIGWTRREVSALRRVSSEMVVEATAPTRPPQKGDLIIGQITGAQESWRFQRTTAGHTTHHNDTGHMVFGQDPLSAAKLAIFHVSPIGMDRRKSHPELEFEFGFALVFERREVPAYWRQDRHTYGPLTVHLVPSFTNTGKFYSDKNHSHAGIEWIPKNLTAIFDSTPVTHVVSRDLDVPEASLTIKAPANVWTKNNYEVVYSVRIVSRRMLLSNGACVDLVYITILEDMKK